MSLNDAGWLPEGWKVFVVAGWVMARGQLAAGAIHRSSYRRLARLEDCLSL